ncbi:MAG: hypothetical protein ACR2LF_11280 [Jatrophihabitantaceae bacterium]
MPLADFRERWDQRRELRQMEGSQRTWLVAVGVLAACVLVAFAAHALSSKSPRRPGAGSPGTPAPTQTPAGTAALAGVAWGYFHRSDRNIAGQTAPSGQLYGVHVQGPSGTGLEIHDGRLVREHPQQYGVSGAPILIVPVATQPGVVAEQYVFTRGRTMNQNVVIGLCATSFAASSIQFAVSPTDWKLFYTVKLPAPARRTAIVTLSSGRFAMPLAVDGVTRYQSIMQVDPVRSSVTVSYPGGTKTLVNPTIGAYIGPLFGVQIRRPLPTDGDAAITAIAAGPDRRAIARLACRAVANAGSAVRGFFGCT